MFFSIFESDIFLNGFPIPFIFHSRPTFFKTEFPFLVGGLSFRMRLFDVDFLFFFHFFILFLIALERSSYQFL